MALTGLVAVLLVLAVGFELSFTLLASFQRRQIGGLSGHIWVFLVGMGLRRQSREGEVHLMNPDGCCIMQVLDQAFDQVETWLIFDWVFDFDDCEISVIKMRSRHLMVTS